MYQDYNSIPLNQWETLRNYEHYNIICYDDYNVDIRSEHGNLLSGSYNFKSNSKETLNNPYCICHILDNNGKYIKKLFHRLVMEHYFPQEDKSLVIDHIDQNKKNNNLRNLRWTTIANNALNTDIFDFVTELPDDAILCDNTVLRTMRPVYFSETTKQFYEQCEGKYKICKWTKDYKLTFASNEGGGKRVNIRLGGLDKLGISLTKEDIAKNQNISSSIVKEESNNFYKRFENIDQSKYKWEPLKYFEENYEVADVDGYGVIRRVNHKNIKKNKSNIIVGKISSKGYHVHRFIMNNDYPSPNKEFRYAKVLTMHYYPIDDYTIDDYSELSIKNEFVKIKDLKFFTPKELNALKEASKHGI